MAVWAAIKTRTFDLQPQIANPGWILALLVASVLFPNVEPRGVVRYGAFSWGQVATITTAAASEFNVLAVCHLQQEQNSSQNLRVLQLNKLGDTVLLQTKKMIYRHGNWCKIRLRQL